MGEILVLIVGFVIEFIGQLLLEFVFELFLGGIAKMIKRIHQRGDEGDGSAILFMYALAAGLGCGAGALSLQVFPHLFVKTVALRLLNLALMPLAVAWVADSVFRRSWTGATRRHGFGYAYVFALAVAAARLGWGQ